MLSSLGSGFYAIISSKSHRPKDWVALTDTWARAEALVGLMHSEREQERARRLLLTRGGGGKGGKGIERGDEKSDPLFDSPAAALLCFFRFPPPAPSLRNGSSPLF